ncbi:MAG TPA: aminoglycoside phosphotransferase family protein [Bacteroides sp.]|nr:aminoglycoside phosphotransferase family protein [Bacteroides sp.]
MKPEEIALQFATRGTIKEVLPHGGGHINDSYRLVNASEDEPDYLLQRINHYVFRNVDLLMKNMALVTEHILRVQQERGTGDLHRRTLTIIPTRDGESYLRITDPEESYWRVLNYIEDHHVFEKAPDPGIAYEGARMFGDFTRMLSGLDASGLGITIPRFHDLKWRISNLRKSIEEDTAVRVKFVEDEIRYIESSLSLMSTVQELGEKGAIPSRVTHNDTKISNVLFDGNRRGLCVIDLDTVMPGYVHFDFGDGIRTFTNTGEEDDRDPNNVRMDLDMYRAFASGFLESTREVLTRAELDSLVYAGVLFPYEQGVRFLTDYLSGDVYYKTRYKEHNLVRTRAQLKLAQDGESKLEQCRKIIRELT